MNKKEIVNIIKKCSCKYIDEIVKYIDFASKSKLITNKRNRKTTHLGYRIITHIFQTNLIHTGDIDIATCSMQKGYLYYLEYLEQMEITNTNKDINHQSTTLFIYDKSIIKYTEENRLLNKLDDKVLSTIPRITKLTETILWLDNNTIQHTDINFYIVKSICEILHNYDDNIINSYIEFGQKRNMNIEEYNEFLSQVFKIFRENAKQKTYSQSDWEEQILKKMPYIEDAKNQTVSKWCKWIWL